MFFGLTIEKLILIGVIAALIVGPERLPKYAEGLARLVKRSREYLRGAKNRVQDEMGPDFEEVDWRKLDPRQYDPRRIIREALLDDAPVKPVSAVMQPATVDAVGIAATPSTSSPVEQAPAATTARPAQVDSPPDAAAAPGPRPVPYDSEAT